MTDTITVLSKPGCVQCNAVIRKLEERGVNYEKVDVSKDEKWLAKLAEWNILRVPVTVQGDKRVEGYDPDGLALLAA